MTLRILWLIVAFACVAPASAWAVDPSRRISQYAHAAWRIQDGLFKSGPRTEIVQTTDGYLWMGTEAGVLRFDGVRFVPWSPPRGDRLPSPDVLRLLAARDGSLWIATGGGLSRWKNQTLTNYPSGPSGVISILEDRNGDIWFGQSQPAADSGPFCRVVDLGTRCYGSADGVPSFRGAGSLLQDAHASLWVGGNTTLMRWSNGAVTDYSPPGLQNNAGIGGILAIAASPDGAIWVGIAKTGPGLGLQRLVEGRWQSFEAPGLTGTSLYVTALYRDREGALWVGTGDHGIYRIHGDTFDHFDSTRGLSSDYVVGLGEDREGNLWVSTAQGLDRFSDTPVVGFSVAEGLCSHEASAVLASRDGSLWIGGDGALGRLRGATTSCIRPENGLPGSQVTSLFEDHDARLWLGIDHGLYLYDDGVFRQVTKLDGSEIGLVSGIAEDAEHNLWITVSGPPRALMRIQGLTVRDEYRQLAARRVAADPTGGLWLGLATGDVARYHNSTLTPYPLPHDGAAMVNQLLPQPDGSLLAATSYGLVGWRQGRLSTLTSTNGLPCDAVYAMTFGDQGNLWLFLDCALVELSSADVQRWTTDPATIVSPRTFDVFDGVRTGRSPFVGAARSPNGRLWFTNGLLLQMVDPGQLRRNEIPPAVHIEQVMADRRAFAATGLVHLPALTRDLQIDYVGLSFVAPQKVLFRYRLDGRDDTWQEPGTRRQAFYNDLRPGNYRFRVIASNNHGVWNEQGASLDFVIAPAWYQTSWFLVLSLVTAGAAAWAAYTLRLRQLAAALNARFDERVAERTRVARELHDTLLQTVQGSKMVADNALDGPDDGVGMRRTLEQLSAWLGQASQEGRAAVNALRASATERNNLAEALQAALDECVPQGTMAASLTVTGKVKELHPVVRDEVFRIAYEAIRNARVHSRGSRLDVGLTYAQDVMIRVADNGVGVDAAVVEHGKDGHFGMPGMRERAARIGATLEVVSPPSGGTAIVVVVPARVASSVSQP